MKSYKLYSAAVGCLAALALMLGASTSWGSSASLGKTEAARSLHASGSEGNGDSGGSGAGTVRLGLTTAVSFSFATPAYVAEDRNFFKDAGLNVKTTAFHSGPKAAMGMAAGQIDVLITDGFDLTAAVSKGVQMKAVAGQESALRFVLVVGAKSGIEKPEQLKGKKVGITSFGALTEYAARLQVQQAGLNPEKDVKLVPLGSGPALVAGLASGAIDAFEWSPALPYGLQVQGKAKIIGGLDARGPQQFIVVAASPSFIRDHRAVLANFLKAYFGAIRYLKDNPDYGVKAVEKSLNLSPAVAKYEYDYEAPYLTPDGKVNTAGLERFARDQVSLKITDKTPPLDSYYTDEFLPLAAD